MTNPTDSIELNAEQKIMHDTLRIVNSTTTYKLDKDKIKTLEDVINVLDGLDIVITLMDGATSTSYEKLKNYLK